jgi:GNAT superfamily N-acetyltransferase
MTPTALVEHLRTSLGAWPPGDGVDRPDVVTVTTSPARSAPSWDGTIVAVSGIATSGGTVLSVPAALASELTGVTDLATAERAVTRHLGSTAAALDRAVYRWTEQVTELDDAGHWVEPTDPSIPAWLRPFNGGVLVATVDGRHAAGVGIKRHDDHGWEIAVVTDPDHRGLGFAARLVAQAARFILAHGAVPIYVHALDNHASAAVAERVGFPDRGWRLLELPTPP